MIALATDALAGFVDDLPLARDAGEATVLVLGSRSVELGRYPRLRGLFRAGVGRENVPWDEARARGIEVGFPSEAAAEILYEEVAGFACQLVLRMAYAEAGTIEPWARGPRAALASRRLLVIGLGNIGRRVAGRMRPFMRVADFDARRPRVDLRAALAEADVVSLHVPLAQDTRGMLGAEELARLPDAAAVVNTARGALVDETALLDEIARGRLRAAFDAFWEEPYRGPLAAFHPERFYMTPHVAGACREFLAAVAADPRAFAARIG